MFTANVLQLGEVADLEALNFNLALMFIRISNVQFSTEPAILPNCCYLLAYLRKSISYSFFKLSIFSFVVAVKLLA